MNGRMIAGVENFDPLVTKMRAEYERLDRLGSRGALEKRQLQQAIESRERMALKRSQLRQYGGRVSDALDVQNARKEAKDLARKMKAAGYTDAQIRATVEPMLVDPNRTMNGRKERKAARKQRREERKAAGKGVFRKIGTALKKAGGFVFKGLAKLNPVLAGARVAFLSLVAKNAGGIADKMHKEGAAKMRKKWEKLGGDFAKLQKAVKKGTGRTITGFIGSADLGPDDDPELMAAEDAAAEGKDTTLMDKLWELAKPILESFFPGLGVKVSTGADGKKKVQVTGSGEVEARLKRELQRVINVKESPQTQAVREQLSDAIDPNTGAGAGYNSGESKVSPMVWVGLAALLIFATKR